MTEALSKLINEMGNEEVLREHKILNVKIDFRFLQPDLLRHIHAELDKTHKLDHKEKLATFIVAVSSYQKDARDHVSCAVKGDTSGGKDNDLDTTLKHIPKEDFIKVTRATSATLEDDVKDKKIIAFSEINKNRENGANADIVETFKQMAEGGTTTLKKDANTGFKTAIRSEQEQKTLIYCTTETESDEELETRYVIIPIKGFREKNKIVISDSLKKARDVSYYLEKSLHEDSWIAVSLSILEKDMYVMIPFTDVIDKGINGKEIFDTTKDRVKRDVKRLLSLTRTIAWLHQKQRVAKYENEIQFLFAEPSDFINALIIFGDFINLTYSGIDHRLQRLLDYAKDNPGKHCAEISDMGFGDSYCDWILRSKAQQDLGIASVNTIKKWIAELKDKGKIDTFYNPSVTNKAFLFRPINSPINGLALPVSIREIDRELTFWLNTDFAKEAYGDHEIKPYLIDFVEYDKEVEQKQSTFTPKNDMSQLTYEELMVTEETIEDNPLPVSQKKLDEMEEDKNEQIPDFKDSQQ